MTLTFECPYCSRQRRVLIQTTLGNLCYYCVKMLGTADDEPTGLPRAGTGYDDGPAGAFEQAWDHMVESLQAPEPFGSSALVGGQLDMVPIESGEGIVLPEQPGDREAFFNMPKEQLQTMGDRVRQMMQERRMADAIQAMDKVTTVQWVASEGKDVRVSEIREPKLRSGTVDVTNTPSPSTCPACFKPMDADGENVTSYAAGKAVMVCSVACERRVDALYKPKMLLEHEPISDPGEAVVDVEGLPGRLDVPLSQRIYDDATKRVAADVERRMLGGDDCRPDVVTGGEG